MQPHSQLSTLNSQPSPAFIAEQYSGGGVFGAGLEPFDPPARAFALVEPRLYYSRSAIHGTDHWSHTDNRPRTWASLSLSTTGSFRFWIWHSEQRPRRHRWARVSCRGVQASATGLRHYFHRGPLLRSRRSIAGNREGYIILLSKRNLAPMSIGFILKWRAQEPRSEAHPGRIQNILLPATTLSSLRI